MNYNFVKNTSVSNIVNTYMYLYTQQNVSQNEVTRVSEIDHLHSDCLFVIFLRSFRYLVFHSRFK